MWRVARNPIGHVRQNSQESIPFSLRLVILGAVYVLSSLVVMLTIRRPCDVITWPAISTLQAQLPLTWRNKSNTQKPEQKHLIDQARQCGHVSRDCQRPGRFLTRRSSSRSGNGYAEDSAEARSVSPYNNPGRGKWNRQIALFYPIRRPFFAERSRHLPDKDAGIEQFTRSRPRGSVNQHHDQLFRLRRNVADMYFFVCFTHEGLRCWPFWSDAAIVLLRVTFAISKDAILVLRDSRSSAPLATFEAIHLQRTPGSNKSGRWRASRQALKLALKGEAAT